MGISVSDLILKATTKCKKGFSCLSGSTDCLCTATALRPDRMVVITPSTADPCDYHRRLGNAHYCLCPVRNDLYTRYKI